MGLYGQNSLNALTANSATSSSATVTTTAASLIAANPDRKFLSIANTGSKSILIGYLISVSATAYAVSIPANTIYEFPVAPTVQLFAIASNGSQTVIINEMS